MDRSKSAILYLIGVIAALVGLFLFENGDTNILFFLLMIIAGVTTFIAWIGALIRTAQLGRWGWFVCLLVLTGITMLIYIIAGPVTSAYNNTRRYR